MPSLLVPALNSILLSNLTLDQSNVPVGLGVVDVVVAVVIAGAGGRTSGGVEVLYVIF